MSAERVPRMRGVRAQSLEVTASWEESEKFAERMTLHQSSGFLGGRGKQRLGIAIDGAVGFPWEVLHVGGLTGHVHVMMCMPVAPAGSTVLVVGLL